MTISRIKIILMATFFILLCIIQADFIAASDIMAMPKAAVTVDGKIDDWNSVAVYPSQDIKWTKIGLEGEGELPREGISSLRLTYDKDDLFILMEFHTPAEAASTKISDTGSMVYIYLDADNNPSTGKRISLADEYTGWDYRISIPAGFIAKTDGGGMMPVAAYNIDKIKDFKIDKEGLKARPFEVEYEGVGLGKESTKDTSHIAFDGKYLEMRLALNDLGMRVPTEIRLAIERLSMSGITETEIIASLKE